MKHCVVEWLITGIEASVGAATLVEPALTKDTAPLPFSKWWQEETSIRDYIVDLQAHQKRLFQVQGKTPVLPNILPHIRGQLPLPKPRFAATLTIPGHFVNKVRIMEAFQHSTAAPAASLDP
jgi:hypothetical protein